MRPLPGHAPALMEPTSSTSPAPVPASSRVSRLAPWVAALGGLGWFLWLGGGNVLPPTRIDWMMREDWAGHIFGWLFYRNAPWGLPLSSSPNQLYPYGTSVALTDGNPLVAVLLKPFDALLPADFQYTGAWLALCFVLMGYFGAKLVAVVSPRPVHQVLGGVLLALTPPMAARFGHPTLVAHWPIVALLWLHLRDTPDAHAARRSLALAALLNAVGASTHPYLVAMLAPLALALAVRLALGRVLGWAMAALAALGVVALDVGVFALFGYFGGSGLGAEGFGDFSADLATLFNPMGWSKLVPSLPAAPRQGEGFGFLGLGALLLLALTGACAPFRFRALRALPWRRVAPLAVVVLLMAFYALSWRVTWTGRQVADLGALYEPFSRLTSAFRSSGRFVWPLCYLLVGGAVLLWLRQWRERPWVGTAALVLAVAVQAYDWRADRSQLQRTGGFRRLQAAEWAELKGAYQHVALFPPQVQWLCRYDEPLVNALGYVAYRLGLTFNSGYASRTPPELARDCHAPLRPGGVDADTVYVVVPEHVPAFLREQARCGVVEGLPVCVAGHRTDAFARALERQPLR
ncbi:DUF6311 domain-containing protein [Pyxidicoccus xibeiensis]|uniref:DUF6311 domain-containing protein n=1 Tax=Pyxidicoccus xibeiensis TaxID=2906759 RepID=UPI0020A70A78|nr:DUF6311 domain-containing protein [Pyxidicoccus xibeiensis]MCP3139536.1 DUF6311 domain-containing protein [Pyxidicoccus xibeiensis]